MVNRDLPLSVMRALLVEGRDGEEDMEIEKVVRLYSFEICVSYETGAGVLCFSILRLARRNHFLWLCYILWPVAWEM